MDMATMGGKLCSAINASSGGERAGGRGRSSPAKGRTGLMRWRRNWASTCFTAVHYATETFGVKALAAHLAGQIPCAVGISRPSHQFVSVSQEPAKTEFQPG